MFETAFRLLVPMLLGFGVSAICPVRSDEVVPQQPPKYVFQIVWPILYLLVGAVWASTGRWQSPQSVVMTVLVMLLSLWIVFFSCWSDKKTALFCLAAIVATLIGAMSILNKSSWSVMALVPVLGWCLIALLLNWESLRYDN
jgi:tryptophan-rich sensory protein